MRFEGSKAMTVRLRTARCEGGEVEGGEVEDGEDEGDGVRATRRWLNEKHNESDDEINSDENDCIQRIYLRKKAHDPNYSLSKRRQHVHDDNMFATNDSQDSMVNWLPHQGTDAQHRAKV